MIHPPPQKKPGKNALVTTPDHVYQKKQAQCHSIKQSHDVIINLSHATVMLFPAREGRFVILKVEAFLIDVMKYSMTKY